MPGQNFPSEYVMFNFLENSHVALYLPEGKVTFLYFCVGILKFKMMTLVTKLLDLAILR